MKNAQFPLLSYSPKTFHLNILSSFYYKVVIKNNNTEIEQPIKITYQNN